MRHQDYSSLNFNAFLSPRGVLPPNRRLAHRHQPMTFISGHDLRLDSELRGNHVMALKSFRMSDFSTHNTIARADTAFAEP